MRSIILVTALFALSLSAFGQGLTIPTFTVGSNDVVQSKIMVFHEVGTNETRVSVKFVFTETGAKRLADFYHARNIGEIYTWQCGNFVHTSKIDDRKNLVGRDFVAWQKKTQCTCGWIERQAMTMPKPQEPVAFVAVSSAIAVQAASRRGLAFYVELHCES